MTDLVARREAVLQGAVREPLDLLVVGGGINGAGILLDAASRGLRALLIEQHDLAEGTSSRSSKLIHGGLRYLEHYHFPLVREALRERATLMRLAPHLVWLRRFVFPVTGGWWEAPYVAAGLTLYDVLGGRRGGPFRRLPAAELQRRSPALRANNVHVGFAYSDGVTDDARYVVAVARTAEQLGGGVVTRARFEGIAGRDRRVRTAAVTDTVTGERYDVRAAAVVDATGAYEVDRPLLGATGHITPSRGSHLVLRREAVPGTAGLTLRVPGRVVFLIPWLGFWLLGTTDVPHSGPVHAPRLTAEEVRYLLDVANESLAIRLTRDDVVGGFAGIRPLVASEGNALTADLSREHRIIERDPGLLAVRGGKFTTYRQIAADVVDRVVAHLGRTQACRTADVALIGAAPRASLSAIAADLQNRSLDQAAASALVLRHGTQARDIAALALSEGLTGRLVAGLPYLQAEVVWAARQEHALGIDDVLSRRTRAALLDAGQAESAVACAASLLGQTLGWDSAQRNAAIARYRAAAGQYRVPAHDEHREALAT